MVAKQGRVKQQTKENTFSSATLNTCRAEMEPVCVDKYAIALVEGVYLTIYMIGHFPLQYDDKFQVPMPMAIGGIGEKFGKYPFLKNTIVIK
jgi:hypothetical protein